MNVNNRSRRHWLVLLLTCGLAITSIGITINAGGVFFTPVAESLGVLRGTFALQSTITLLGTAIVSLYAPRIMKKYRYRSILLVSVLAAGLATIAMAFSRSVPLFYLLGAIRGVATGLFGGVPLTMIVNEWFEKHHGLATSLVLGCSGVGGALFSPLFATLIQSIGWENTYIVMGVIMMALCVPALVIPFALTPQEEGLLPYGYSETAQAEGAGGVREKGRLEMAKASLLAVFVFSVLHTAVSGIPHHFPGFAETLRFSATIGATMLSAGMIGNIVSKLIIGFLSDRLGAFRAIAIMIVVNVLSIFILLSGLSAGFMIAGAFLFGSVFSVAGVGLALLARELFGTQNYGKVYPVISFATAAGGAFSLSIVGYIYDFTGSYRAAFLISLAIHAINLGLLVFLVRKVRQQERSLRVACSRKERIVKGM